MLPQISNQLWCLKKVDLRLRVFWETAFIVRVSPALPFLSFLNGVLAAAVSLDQADDDADLQKVDSC